MKKINKFYLLVIGLLTVSIAMTVLISVMVKDDPIKYVLMICAITISLIIATGMIDCLLISKKRKGQWERHS